jgi:exportin-2 (importin alpha re-exporter)
MLHFEKSVTLIVNDYIQHYLTQYRNSNAPTTPTLARGDWRSKDTALFLFSAIAIKSSTSGTGVTSTNLLVDVCRFWTENCEQEFVGGTAHHVLQADYIRYIYVFRNQVNYPSFRL